MSDKWRFQRSSQRWSRRDLDLNLSTSNTEQDSLDKAGIRSSSSHDSVLTDNEESLSQQDDSSPVLHTRQGHQGFPPPQSHSSPNPELQHNFLPRSAVINSSSPFTQSSSNYFHHKQSGQNGDVHLNHQSSQQNAEKLTVQNHESPLSPGSIRRAASERFKGAKNNFLKRMESLKQKRSAPRKLKRPSSPGEKMEISGPVVCNSDTDSFKERMDRYGCKDITPSPETSPSFKIDKPLAHKSGHSAELDLSVEGADISPSLFKRGGRVFVDTSNSSLEDSVKLNSGNSQSFTNGGSSDLSTELPAVFAQLGIPLDSNNSVCHVTQQQNHSSSNLNDSSTTGSKHSPGGFPKLVANGYIETNSGSQINYRTGSFNLGADSETYRDSYLRKNKPVYNRASSEEPNAKTILNTRPSLATAEHRLSIYDNVPATESDPQKELDLILNDLFKNINDLTQRSQEVEDELADLGGQEANDESGKECSIKYKWNALS